MWRLASWRWRQWRREKDRMKITYGAVVLGDDGSAPGDFITWEQREHGRQVQKEQLFMAADEFTAGRGNARNTIGFMVDKLHADGPTAMDFVLDHPEALSNQAVLKFEQGVAGNARYVNDAALESVSLVKIDGRSTVFRYRFTGGAVTTS
jgi:hypothetical protein